jgi:hypothetical protein
MAEGKVRQLSAVSSQLVLLALTESADSESGKQFGFSFCLIEVVPRNTNKLRAES